MARRLSLMIAGAACRPVLLGAALANTRSKASQQMSGHQGLGWPIEVFELGINNFGIFLPRSWAYRAAGIASC